MATNFITISFSPPDGALVAGVVIGILAGIIVIVAIMVVVWVRVIRTDSTAFLHDDTTKQRAQLYRFVDFILCVHLVFKLNIQLFSFPSKTLLDNYDVFVYKVMIMTLMFLSRLNIHFSKFFKKSICNVKTFVLTCQIFYLFDKF